MASSSGHPTVTLVLGSGPDALDAANWQHKFDAIVAINNAWQVRGDWTHLIHPEDFAADRLPYSINKTSQTVVTANDYVPVQNDYGGFVYAGGTMAFTAGYWALGALKPDVLAFFGCDMNYGTRNGKTHFYGEGDPDPLRADVTLQSLEAKSTRLMLMAAAQGCMTINLSNRAHTRLVFPRVTIEDLGRLTRQDMQAWLSHHKRQSVQMAVDAALAREAELGYFVPSGRYWEEPSRFDAAALRDLDALWLSALAR